MPANKSDLPNIEDPEDISEDPTAGKSSNEEARAEADLVQWRQDFEYEKEVYALRLGFFPKATKWLGLFFVPFVLLLALVASIYKLHWGIYIVLSTTVVTVGITTGAAFSWIFQAGKKTNDNRDEQDILQRIISALKNIPKDGA